MSGDVFGRHIWGEMVLVASGGWRTGPRGTGRPRQGVTRPQAPVVLWPRKPRSPQKQSPPFPNGRPRKHVYGCDVDLAQAHFGSQRGHRPPAAPNHWGNLALPAHTAEAGGEAAGWGRRHLTHEVQTLGKKGD